MALYGASARALQGSTNAGGPLFDIKANSLGGTSVLEIAFMQTHQGNNTTPVGLGRSVSEVFQAQSIVLSPYDPADKPTTTSLGISWTVPPSQPTQYFRQFAIANVVLGSGVIWSFPRGLKMSGSTSLIVWMASVSVMFPAAQVYVEVDE